MKSSHLVFGLFFMLVAMLPTTAYPAVAKQKSQDSEVSVEADKSAKNERKSSRLRNWFAKKKAKLVAKIKWWRAAFSIGIESRNLLTSLILLVLAIVFFAVGGLTVLGALFNTLGSVAVIGSLLFFVLWLIDRARAASPAPD